jgi:hypothetical protein
VSISAATYGPTLHDLRCRAASLGLSIIAKQEQELDDEDFGPLFLIREDGYLEFPYGMPAASVAVLLDCIEREAWEDSPCWDVWESLEPFINKDGAPLRRWKRFDELQRQYILRCIQIAKLGRAAA